MLWNNPTEMGSLWHDMNALRDAMQRTFGGERGNPALRLYEKGEELLLRFEIPGATTDELQISVKDDTLSLGVGKQRTEPGEKVAVLRRERPGGSASRSIRLPYRVAPDSVNARMNDGILEIRMSRAEEDKPKKIAVQAG